MCLTSICMLRINRSREQRNDLEYVFLVDNILNQNLRVENWRRALRLAEQKMTVALL